MSFLRLSDVADINPKLPGRPLPSSTVSFVAMADVNVDAATTSAGSDRNFSEVQKGYTLFQDLDLLVAKITPCFENGKIAQASLKYPIGAGSTEFHVVRARSSLLNPRYGLHFLRQAAVREAGRLRMTGSGGQRRVPADFLSNLLIPVPPLSEQRRIAEVLDRADALLTKRRESFALHEDLTRSIFIDMFGHPSAVEGRWPRGALGDVARTTSGGTPSRTTSANYGGTIPWVKSGELHSGVVVTTEESLTELGLANSSARIMSPGAVLVAMYGATAGIIATLGISAATNQAVCSIEVGPSLDSTFLRKALQLLTPKLLVQRVGGAQPNLSQGAIRALAVPLPPLVLQQEFAERIRTVEIIRERHMQHQRRMANLFASLQRRAFTDEL